MTKVFAVMVTYQRAPDALETSKKLMLQTRPPDHVWVIDNSPSEFLAVHFSRLSGFTYLPQSENLGPAGGIAAGMNAVLTVAADEDWILIVDDDDPPSEIDVLEKLLSLVDQAKSDRLGGVALLGAKYNKSSGSIIRCLDEELVGVVRADYFAGGQFPMYAVKAIRDVGVCDPKLFFGFDDLEFGLRLRRAQWQLCFNGPRALEQRVKAGRTGLGQRSPGRHDMPGWRRYYSARNSVVIAKRYGSLRGVVRISLGTVASATLRLIQRRSSMRHCLLSIRGVVDGLIGRLGRTVAPGRK